MCDSDINAVLSAKVMIVDDEESIRHAVTKLLCLENIPTVSASGAQECLQLLKSGFRGVILMDVMMPVKNGWQTIREIESEGLLQGNIISMLTAMEVPDEQMNGLQEVVIDYIVKPFNTDDFIVSVKRYLAMQDQLHTGE